MKKIIMPFATVLLLLTMTPAQAKDGTIVKPTSSVVITGAESAEVKALVARVNEIKAMDKTSLSASEKKELRKELRSIKKEVNRRDGGGYYISGGLILLIIILIILL